MLQIILRDMSSLLSYAFSWTCLRTYFYRSFVDAVTSYCRAIDLCVQLFPYDLFMLGFLHCIVFVKNFRNCNQHRIFYESSTAQTISILKYYVTSQIWFLAVVEVECFQNLLPVYFKVQMASKRLLCVRSFHFETQPFDLFYYFERCSRGNNNSLIVLLLLERLSLVSWWYYTEFLIRALINERTAWVSHKFCGTPFCRCERSLRLLYNTLLFRSETCAMLTSC